MSPETVTVFMAFLAQGVVAALLAAVLQGFLRHYGRDYLRQWALSWWAMAVQLVLLAAGTFLSADHPPAHPLRVAVGLVGQVAGYLQIGWLIFGTHAVVTGRPVPRSHSRQLLLGLAVAGVAASVAMLSLAPPSPYGAVVRFGVRAVPAGLAFALAGLRIWPRRHGSDDLGRALVATGFVLYGLELLHHAGWTFAILLLGDPSVYPFYLGFVDLILQALIGLGMVVWLLEEERRALVKSAEQVEYLAYHDPLTGLPNRQLFVDRLTMALEQAGRVGHRVAVVFLDLDRFKVINDTLGHSFGDQVLRVVAGRLRRCVRDADTVARRGGDEFTLLLPGLEDEGDAVAVARKLLEAMRLPLKVQDREFVITASFGIALYPANGGDAETLVRHADLALYRAKELGRDTFQFYTDGLERGSPERLDLERDLRRALSSNELVLHYQPLVDLRTQGVRGVEALIRWQHPTRGLMPPAEFLPLADAMGLMSTVDLWVLRESCSQLRSWQRGGLKDLRMAVNLSSKPFQHQQLVTWVSDVLADTGVRPESLELEITETTAMQDLETSQYVMRHLKERGVRIAIDDFGTGYSSLSYLRSFPLDTLKIDQLFVRDLAEDPRLAHTVIALAHSLGLRVVAEGVESERQRLVLANDECDEGQGFLFSRPVPAAQCESLLFGNAGGGSLNAALSAMPV